MSNKAYLGIFGPGPNSSAAICSDHEIIAWAEEERFNRIKTAPNSYPSQAIAYCLAQAEKRGLEVAAVGYGWDCENYAELATENLKETIEKYPSETDHISLRVQQSLNALYDPEMIKNDLGLILRKNGIELDDLDFSYYPHHLCHAATAHYCSGYDDSVVVINDGVGEVASSTLYHADTSGNFKELAHVELPNTLGGLYASVTEFLGFRAYMDEGKTMGLAAYGKPNKEIQAIFDEIARDIEDDFGYIVNPRYRYSGKRTYGKKFTDLLVEKLGLPRKREQSAMDAPYPDIAYAAQKQLEKFLLSQLEYAAGLGLSKNATFAGGVHMNCKANGVLGESGLFDHYFFQPAASDNGIPLGAAMLANQDVNQKAPEYPPLNHLYYGPSFSDDEIETVLKKCKLKYRKTDNIAGEVAQLIADNAIVGWFQGRMEVGARALGGRSILANPLNPDARDHVNKHVKNREAWRPFCPSLQSEFFKTYFDTELDSSRYMITACSIKEDYLDVLPSCIHIDGTVRPQTVEKTVNPLYWEVLNEFEKLTGHPIVVNTSFNVQGEPIVMRPEEAIRCFFGSGMDVLAMGSFLIQKQI
jgi:carbamoyltransferase